MHLCAFIYIYIYTQNNYTQCTHVYYVDTNFYFGCDKSFDSPKHDVCEDQSIEKGPNEVMKMK